ncbi:hypothetical protein T310_1460 [Rasamsonia emersonii CBS 393.64]|uniref:Uncharacterized protein n=1 Tax=Rasamsonia emersonii (strain ATCC 16479 / CBS 393.64 / IMI 116815) TaxID=1408163 RepID=A0A0F4Z217_RASE3|nr:hypothetical protein T310_1460 [Rasamsonia emersonii CBS 393.64]KKA24559.1 hypothetical protein T310_1460 [Rasamsonia emersonii CBS 393.64]
MSSGPSQDVDHQCIGGRRVLNCQMCAGHPPRMNICRHCKGAGFRTLPCNYCYPATTTARDPYASSSSSSSMNNTPGSSVRLRAMSKGSYKKE